MNDEGVEMTMTQSKPSMKNAITLWGLYVMTVIIYLFIQLAYIPEVASVLADQGSALPYPVQMVLSFNDMFLQMGVLYILISVLFCAGLLVLLTKVRTKKWPLFVILILTALQMVVNLVLFSAV